MTSNRFTTFDLLKGIAVILMIQVHIIELFATQGVSHSIAGKMLMFLGGPPVAPVFLIVFGFFIARNNKSPLQLLKRGAIVLIIGLLLNIALNFNLIISVFFGKYQIDVLPYIFGVDILINAGIVLFIMALIKHFVKQSIVPLILLILLAAFLGKYLLSFLIEGGIKQYFLAVFYGTSWWSYFPVFPWFTYTLAGYTFFYIVQKTDIKFIYQIKYRIIFGVLFILFLLFTFKYAINTASDLPLYYHHDLVFFLWVIVFIAFYAYFAHEIENVLGSTVIFKFIKWLGKNVTLVYIIQWIIIGNIATAIYRSITSFWLLLLCFSAVLAISTLLAFLMEKFQKAKL